MRFLPVLAFLVLLIGCADSQDYTERDYRQVTSVYAELVPVYQDFKRAYSHGDHSAMRRDFDREQNICRIVDTIDARDTIDPSSNLFQASVTLDNICNTIESVYAGWNKSHGLPYDKSITPGDASWFVPLDLSLKVMPHLLKHPAHVG